MNPLAHSLIDTDIRDSILQSAWGNNWLAWNCADLALTECLAQTLQPDELLEPELTGGQWGPVQVARQEGGANTADPRVAEHSPDKPHLQKLFHEGYSIILNDLHLRQARCAQLTLSLRETLGCGINCNAYLTPADSQALGRHYDDEDVIILQILGSKTWDIWAPGEPDSVPCPGLAYSERQANAGDLLCARTLTAGDCLYLPAGFAHAAHTSGQTSLHLTFSLSTPRVADAMIALIRQTMMTPSGGNALRRPLPFDPEKSYKQVLSGFVTMAQRVSLSELKSVIRSLSVVQTTSPDTDIRLPY